MAVPDTQLRIPFTTLLKIALFALMVAILVRTTSVLVMLLVASLLAVMLAPFESWLEERGVRRGLAMTLLAFLVFGIVAAFVILVVPRTLTETQQVSRHVPALSERVSREVPFLAPYAQALAAELQRPPTAQQAKRSVAQGLKIGGYAAAALINVAFVLVLTLYLVVDGKRLAAWLISFAPRAQRKKIAMTADEVRPVIFAYMRGQLITSTLAASVALAVLLPLHVPAALPLAVLAFFGDFIPVIGTIAAVTPAVLLALVVGPTQALIVAAVYVAYHLIESYIIIPRVYGRQMRLSTLTVLLSVFIGWSLLGPLGSVLILPVVAAYPPIEHIWLRDRLAPDTIEKHDAIEDGDEEEVDKVLRP
ncbi:MAG TPA: AI-2E family transporter, partial [Thermoanaerobaculia bacterium]|nr:AI-2E family transporter [Thermoanaerobaculia bacterium]